MRTHNIVYMYVCTCWVCVLRGSTRVFGPGKLNTFMKALLFHLTQGHNSSETKAKNIKDQNKNSLILISKAANKQNIRKHVFSRGNFWMCSTKQNCRNFLYFTYFLLSVGGDSSILWWDTKKSLERYRMWWSLRAVNVLFHTLNAD